MQSFNAGLKRPASFAAATALAAISIFSLSSVSAEPVNPPPVPANIQIPAGNRAFLVGHALGTQNYSCLPAGVDASGIPRFAWTLFTPQATLFAQNQREITTHYFSPNPYEPSPSPFAEGPIRATWQDSKDTSTVWGKVVPGDSSTDAAYVAPGAIPWLRITVVGTEDGPTGGDTLSVTTYLHRVNTTGGVAPSTGCASLSDVGKQAFVHYTADYYFYRKAKGGPADG
jgi:hypothetical protein